MRCLLLAAFALLMLAGPAARAQAPDPDEGGPTPEENPTAVPIDGGASLLLLGGLGLGVARLRRRR